MANKEYVNLAGLTAYKSLWETEKNQIIEEGTDRVGDTEIARLFGKGRYIFVTSQEWNKIVYTENFIDTDEILAFSLTTIGVPSLVSTGDKYYIFSDDEVYISNNSSEWTRYYYQGLGLPSKLPQCDGHIYYYNGLFYYFDIYYVSKDRAWYSILHYSENGYEWNDHVTDIKNLVAGDWTSPVMGNYLVLHNGNYTYMIGLVHLWGSRRAHKSQIVYADINNLTTFNSIGYDTFEYPVNIMDNRAFLISENKALFICRNTENNSIYAVDVEVLPSGVVTKTVRESPLPIACVNQGNEYGFSSSTIYINGELNNISETIISMIKDESDGAYMFTTADKMYHIHSNNTVLPMGEIAKSPLQGTINTETCIAL